MLPAFSQSLPPKPKWSVDDIPDLSGKVMIVTGGNTGVGKETVKALLQHNATVYLAARDAEKAKQTIEDLKSTTGKEAAFLHLDLSDLRIVRKSAEDFLSREKRLHVLFNNAGVMACPMNLLTEQGYDMQIGTNVIGHYFFTSLLLPALEAASITGDKARIVTTSSLVAYFAKDFIFDAVKDGPRRRKLNPRELYNISKLGDALLALELSRRWDDKIVSVAVNPGNIKTDLQRHMPGWQRPLVNLMLYPSPMGALSQLWAGVSPEGASLNGLFIIPWARVGTAPAKAQDHALAEKLWSWVDDLCRGY
ncbi:unnamed protein product [Peniophora sp. CBMAI 1063]|nr:unnamed protein product [Peniophora sp. CBMAI 1063]